ncbi:MAG: hypothetical protein KC621_22845 [Myxococcales bacterium]|nr:hypothetical protein [Myxococcales bacterium]
MSWMMSAAWADVPASTWTVGEHRSVKIDRFSYGPALHPWGSDWKPTMLEQWTVVVDCQTIAARVEQCSFSENPWWGWVVDESAEISWIQLPRPPSFEVVWTKTGRVQSYDPAVDPGDFGDSAANAMLQATYRRSDVVFKPDGLREIGSNIWTGLVCDLVSAMEVELPKKGQVTGWTWTKPPTVARRYVQGIATGQLEVKAGQPAENGIPLAMAGRITEAPPAGGMGTGAVDTVVKGRAIIEPTTGRPVSVRWDTIATSSSIQLVGHTRQLVLLEPWASGQESGPAAMPQPELP